VVDIWIHFAIREMKGCGRGAKRAKFVGRRRNMIRFRGVGPLAISADYRLSRM